MSIEKRNIDFSRIAAQKCQRLSSVTHFAGSSMLIFYVVVVQQLSRILITTLLARKDCVRSLYIPTVASRGVGYVPTRINFVLVIVVILEVILDENQSLVAQRQGCAYYAALPS